MLLILSLCPPAPPLRWMLTTQPKTPWWSKRPKRGQKELDLKTIIPHVEYEQAGEQLQFNLVLPCGSGEAPNYNPALLLGYLQQQYNIPPWLCSVLRTKLYTKNNEEFC